jgi:hypothetical protein
MKTKTKTTVTEQLAALEQKAMNLAGLASAKQAEYHGLRADEAQLTQRADALEASQVAGREVGDDLGRVRADLEQVRSRLEEGWTSRLSVAGQAAHMADGDMKAFALANAAALWEERAPTARAAVKAVRDAAAELNAAMVAYQGVLDESSRLCGLTVGASRYHMPGDPDIRTTRRALAELVERLPVPIPLTPVAAPRVVNADEQDAIVARRLPVGTVGSGRQATQPEGDIDVTVEVR